MKEKIRIFVLILFCLYSAFFFIGSILAPIMAHFQQYEISAHLTTLYMFSCHQQPDRSFWILGYPVSLCCRCLGFYLGVIIFGTISIFNKLKINLKTFLILLIITITDIYINYGMGIRIHNTGNITRFFVGLIMGLLFVIVLNFLLIRKWRKL
jgi:uncharacterized membrane protein